ncbi:hypothetical protein CEXT_508811 [Caerostris extrusa]|uniref:Uncharacterized protein n=1 Tax=Caerostris extrusa TaxID=172846 RepID=A0AAV4MDT1_CAEEX|nr:hypothetical protein CEXT_508811 [Caerostris extrusa]
MALPPSGRNPLWLLRLLPTGFFNRRTLALFEACLVKAEPELKAAFKHHNSFLLVKYSTNLISYCDQNRTCNYVRNWNQSSSQLAHGFAPPHMIHSGHNLMRLGPVVASLRTSWGCTQSVLLRNARVTDGVTRWTVSF